MNTIIYRDFQISISISLSICKKNFNQGRRHWVGGWAWEALAHPPFSGAKNFYFYLKWEQMKGRESTEKSDKNDIRRKAYSQKSYLSHTNSSMYWLIPSVNRKNYKTFLHIKNRRQSDSSLPVLCISYILAINHDKIQFTPKVCKRRLHH